MEIESRSMPGFCSYTFGDASYGWHSCTICKRLYLSKRSGARGEGARMHGWKYVFHFMDGSELTQQIIALPTTGMYD
jgi:hypothetical protein